MSPVRCSHFTLGIIQKSRLSAVLLVHTCDCLRYLRRQQTVTQLLSNKTVDVFGTQCTRFIRGIFPVRSIRFFVFEEKKNYAIYFFLNTPTDDFDVFVFVLCVIRIRNTGNLQ